MCWQWRKSLSKRQKTDVADLDADALAARIPDRLTVLVAESILRSHIGLAGMVPAGRLPTRALRAANYHGGGQHGTSKPAGDCGAPR
jgi:hypothetical protein